MRRYFIIFTLLATLVLGSCSKDVKPAIKGTVIQAGGCYPNSWLVRIDNPGDDNSFLCVPGSYGPGANYDCSNALFINMPDDLAKPGTRVRFDAVTSTEFSCLSSSNAPLHAEVKNLRGE